MNIIIIILFIIVILIIIINRKKEKMTDIVPSTNESLESNLKTKCCIVEKKYLPDNINKFGGNFKYLYSNKENEECDPSLYDLNNNKQLLIDGENNWNNNKCKEQNSIIGSCRLINNECIDFVDKEFCDKIPNMTWSKKTCNNPLEFIWKDRIIRNVPERDTHDGSFVLFPEKLKKF